MDTTLEFIDFESLLTKIQLNDFNVFLPSTIKRVAKTKEDQDDPPRDNKRRRVKGQVRNANLKEDLKLKRGEDWKAIFKGKSRDGPTLSIGTYP